MQPIKTAKIALIAFGAFALPAQAEESGAPSRDRAGMPQPIERASADDCAIIVEVGKSRMNWGATPPEFAFYPEFDRVGGGTYLEDCPWKELGVAEPLTSMQQTEKSFFITRPAYSGNDATVELQFAISGRIVDGKKTPPFIKSETCTLEKQGNRWRLRQCKLKMIS